MSKGGKIALWSLVGITVAGVATFVALKWDGFVGIIKGEQTYSHAEVLEIEEKAYQKGLSKQNEYEIEIKDYKLKLEDLSNKINNLTEKGTLDKNTIRELNIQISNLSNELANSENNNEELQAEIDELTLKIQEYQEIAEQLEIENKVAVTLVYDGQIYGNSMIVDKGTTVTLAEPEDTDYIKFNYWYIDGNNVAIGNSITVTENTRIVADLTYYQKISYLVDGATSSEFVECDTLLTKTNPEKQGYVFKGWSINGQVVDLTTYKVSEDVTLVAVFELKTTILNIVATESEMVYLNSDESQSGYAAEQVTLTNSSLHENIVGGVIKGSFEVTRAVGTETKDGQTVHVLGSETYNFEINLTDANLKSGETIVSLNHFDIEGNKVDLHITYEITDEQIRFEMYTAYKKFIASPRPVICEDATGMLSTVYYGYIINGFELTNTVING